jgi:hypothetical protein
VNFPCFISRNKQSGKHSKKKLPGHRRPDNFVSFPASGPIRAAGLFEFSRYA